MGCLVPWCIVFAIQMLKVEHFDAMGQKPNHSPFS